MRTSIRGKELITKFEGLVPHAYNDPVGHCTFGVGHLIHRGNCTAQDFDNFGSKARPKPGARTRALRILGDDLMEFEAAVRAAVKVPLNQNEFDALVSLAFNIGVGAFGSSTVVRELNKGHRFRAGAAFMMWTKASGRTLLGLVRRRAAERRRFRSKWKAGKRVMV